MRRDDTRRFIWGLDERLLLWLALLVGGYAWVAMLQCGRASPFIGRGGDYIHFMRLMLLALPLYLAGPRHVLRAWREEGSAALWWNLLAYVLPFFVGLQFFYLQRIDAINYSLNYHDLSTMGVTGIVVFSAVAALIVGLALFHVKLAHEAGFAGRYVTAFFACILLIAAITIMVRDTRYLHIHHWALFCFFVPFARFRHPVSGINGEPGDMRGHRGGRRGRVEHVHDMGVALRYSSITSLACPARG